MAVNARNQPPQCHTCQQIPTFVHRQDGGPVIALDLMCHSAEAIEEAEQLRVAKVLTCIDQSCSTVERRAFGEP